MERVSGHAPMHVLNCTPLPPLFVNRRIRRFSGIYVIDELIDSDTLLSGHKLGPGSNFQMFL